MSASRAALSARRTPSASTRSDGGAHARRILKRDRNTIQIDPDADDVACRSGLRRHNGHRTAGKPVQKRRLAGIDRAGEADGDTAADTLALPAIVKDGFDRRREIPRFGADPRQQLDRQLLIGEIDQRLEIRRQRHQRRTPGLDGTVKRAVTLAPGLKALAVCLGVDQIGKRLGTEEVDLAVGEHALRELAGSGRPKPL